MAIFLNFYKIVEKRDYDCVMIFENGNPEDEWTPPSDGHHTDFNYLQKVDPNLLEIRDKILEKAKPENASSMMKKSECYQKKKI